MLLSLLKEKLTNNFKCPLENDGVMIILSSPSGAGKTTLVKSYLRRITLKISISHTTRQPRPNETTNKDYYFVNDEI